MPPPSLKTARDIPLLITSTASSSERRITPSWSIAQLKSRLEPVTGIPPAFQQLSLRLPDQQQTIIIQAEDESSVEIGNWPLAAYAEIKVTSINGNGIATLPPPSSVPKYTMPESVYETRPETLLAYKKTHKIGRFDPAAPEIQEQKIKDMWEEVDERMIIKGARCHLFGEPHRRGSIAYIGPIAKLPGLKEAPWIGIVLDEPTGKNDGSVDGQIYFQCEKNRGVIVRADRVVVGDFGVLALEEEDPDMEEI